MFLDSVVSGSGREKGKNRFSLSVFPPDLLNCCKKRTTLVSQKLGGSHHDECTNFTFRKVDCYPTEKRVTSRYVFPVATLNVCKVPQLYVTFLENFIQLYISITRQGHMRQKRRDKMQVIMAGNLYTTRRIVEGYNVRYVEIRILYRSQLSDKISIVSCYFRRIHYTLSLPHRQVPYIQ